ncbi:biotin transport system substrate-specific component [Kineococcus xinjiangensis]|uniref:Biotin transport system substrate-specific component n=1 Tax=Kineococcus xinjiangensis TaxID=512762 RepID=A0A2S6IPN6_9ACTN|nr:biotin transporter BioY [Kineococcus xinjiangensis]PPK96168.1 biotin transport system substrate-specific component [Kineococcus xinjiangensis]
MRTSRRWSSRDLALVASFAALIAVLGLPGALYVFGNTVPITLQTLGVMLAGAILGWRRGAAAVLVFLVLVAVGLPLLSGGRGGLGVFAGPSVGYLIAWPLGAAVTGALVQARWPRYPLWWGVLANVIGGMVVVYALGIPGVAVMTGTPLAAAAASAVIYLPGDLAKALIAAIVTAGVRRGYPRIAEEPRLLRRDPKPLQGRPLQGRALEGGPDTAGQQDSQRAGDTGTR